MLTHKQPYLLNMERSCKEYSLLDFSGMGYFFRNMTVPKQDDGAARIAIAIFHGILLNASNIVERVPGIDTDALWRDALKAMEHGLSAGQPEDGRLPNFIGRRDDSWRERYLWTPWKLHVLGVEGAQGVPEGIAPSFDTREPIACSPSRNVREFDFAAECRTHAHDMVDDYRADPSIGSLTYRELAERYGCNLRYPMQFKNWLKLQK